jgi:hypothetical protein
MSTSEAIKRGAYYPLGDWHPLNRSLPSLGYSSNDVMAQWDGQLKRCPKAGEWYLSGSVITAYKAPNDLSTSFYIAKLFKVKKVILTQYDQVHEVE